MIMRNALLNLTSAAIKVLRTRNNSDKNRIARLVMVKVHEMAIA